MARRGEARRAGTEEGLDELDEETLLAEMARVGAMDADLTVAV